MNSISVERESYGKEANVFRTMLPKLERGLEVVEKALLIAWCCRYGGVGSLFNVLHHNPDFSPGFLVQPPRVLLPSQQTMQTQKDLEQGISLLQRTSFSENFITLPTTCRISIERKNDCSKEKSYT